MIRKIVDYQKLNEDILNILVEKFPDGYDDDDIISFKNANNELIEAVEVRTDDTIYLVKIGVKLVKAMEKHQEEDYDDLQDDDSTNDTVDIDALNEEDLE
jgi:DNA-directed RNA polymerase subunit delta